MLTLNNICNFATVVTVAILLAIVIGRQGRPKVKTG
jgi:hypothetical protein